MDDEDDYSTAANPKKRRKNKSIVASLTSSKNANKSRSKHVTPSTLPEESLNDQELLGSILSDMNRETEKQVKKVLNSESRNSDPQRSRLRPSLTDETSQENVEFDDMPHPPDEPESLTVNEANSQAMEEDDDDDGVYIEQEENLVINPGIKYAVTPASVVKRSTNVNMSAAPSDTPLKTPTAIVRPKFAVPTLPSNFQDSSDPHAACKNSWNSVIGSNVLHAASTPGAEATAAASVKSCLEEDGSLNMFWFDACEISGGVFLFGKVYMYLKAFMSKVLSRDQNKFVSCCLAIQNIERNVFVLPRSFKVDGFPHCPY